MSVTAPAGFRAAGIAAGIKPSGEPDLALVVNDGPGDAAAGVFTTNRVTAAPVRWSKLVLDDGRLRAIVLNSGGANACTGTAGFADTEATAERAAKALNLDPTDIAVASTGLIGERLPMPAVLAGVDAATSALTGFGGADAARAILTTDTVPKQAVATGTGFRVGGMAKGAGMLAPGLATMLVVLTTDAVLDPPALDLALREATRYTFDRIDSDGSMSTNDSVYLMASGANRVAPALDEFTTVVRGVCHELAMALLTDAEGATKDIAIEVVRAATESDALAAARAVARDSLVKCALYGADPNWGRILAAAGTSRAEFDPDRADLWINGVRVCHAGTADEPRDRVDLSGRSVRVRLDLAAGDAEATVWTNDLTPGYVHENSAYST